MENNNEIDFVIRPCTHTQLAAAYGVSRKVLYTWLRPYKDQIGQRKGYKYSIEQLLLIYDLVGYPTSPIP